MRDFVDLHYPIVPKPLSPAIYLIALSSAEMLFQFDQCCQSDLPFHRFFCFYLFLSADLSS